MQEADHFVVRRSAGMLAFQIMGALAIVGIGLLAPGWMPEAPTAGQTLLCWLLVAGGAAALLLLGLRLRQPAEWLVIDRHGLRWWKADRPLGWAEIERLWVDGYQMTLFLHVRLAAGARGVATATPHAAEALGRLITASDLSFRLTGSDATRDGVRAALERFAPAGVEVASKRG